MKTKVLFRKFPRTGEIIALFPELPGTPDPQFCESYMHTGQHGPAHVGLTRCTSPASPEESAPLASELQRIGYDLLPVSRLSPAMFRERVRNGARA